MPSWLNHKTIAKVLEIAEDFAKKTENTKDDMIIAILISLNLRFGPDLIGQGTCDGASWSAGLPSDVVPEVEQLAASIESEQA